MFKVVILPAMILPAMILPNFTLLFLSNTILLLPSFVDSFIRWGPRFPPESVPAVNAARRLPPP